MRAGDGGRLESSSTSTDSASDAEWFLGLSCNKFKAGTAKSVGACLILRGIQWFLCVLRNIMRRTRQTPWTGWGAGPDVIVGRNTVWVPCVCLGDGNGHGHCNSARVVSVGVKNYGNLEESALLYAA